jgi:hypothetical protein
MPQVIGVQGGLKIDIEHPNIALRPCSELEKKISGQAITRFGFHFLWPKTRTIESGPEMG